MGLLHTKIHGRVRHTSPCRVVSCRVSKIAHESRPCSPFIDKKIRKLGQPKKGLPQTSIPKHLSFNFSRYSGIYSLHLACDCRWECLQRSFPLLQQLRKIDHFTHIRIFHFWQYWVHPKKRLEERTRYSSSPHNYSNWRCFYFMARTILRLYCYGVVGGVERHIVAY